VLHDEALVDIARKAPRTVDDLKRLRSLSARELERSAPALLARVEQGLAVAEAARPVAMRQPRLSQKEELMVKLLDTCLKALCQRQKLSASCIGNRGDLETLVHRYRHGQLATTGSPLLDGWRGALIGQELLAVLEGRLGVHLDPTTGAMVLTPRTR
jgi:ribonuclease D